MTTNLMIQNSILVLTECCKNLLFLSQNNSVIQVFNKSNTNSAITYFQVSVDSLVLKPITIELSVSFSIKRCVYSNNNSSLPTLTPNSYTLYPGAVTNSFNFLAQGLPGCYQVIAADVTKQFSSRSVYIPFIFVFFFNHKLLLLVSFCFPFGTLRHFLYRHN